MVCPKVSVVMPVYNGEKYLNLCLESVLHQTYTNIELVIINDGSTDGSHSIIQKYINSLENVIYINRKNKGLIYSLNEGFNECTGEFIARMDADDICHPDRIGKQVSYMNANPNVAVCGTYVEKINEDSKTLGHMKMPLESSKASIRALFRSPIIHPTAMFRKSSIYQYFPDVYSKEYKDAEDYQLWVKLISDGLVLTNLKEPLLRYRVHDSSITSQNKVQMKKMSHKVRSFYINKIFNGEVDKTTVNLLTCMVTRSYYEVGDEGCNNSIRNYFLHVGLKLGKAIQSNFSFSDTIYYYSEFFRFLISLYKYKHRMVR